MQGVTPVVVSLFDRSALAAAFARHDAVVNLASAMPSMTRFMFRRAWRATERVRVEGSAAVVDAAIAAGVGRVVQESVAMLYRDHGAEWIGEEAPGRPLPRRGRQPRSGGQCAPVHRRRRHRDRALRDVWPAFRKAFPDANYQRTFTTWDNSENQPGGWLRKKTNLERPSRDRLRRLFNELANSADV